jgi:uncharacterized protein (UPF0147 family)
MCKELIEEIILEIEFINEDNSIPKNLKLLLKNIEHKINKDCNDVEISNILYELEDLINNTNMPQFCRSAVWSLVSKLEILKESMI